MLVLTRKPGEKLLLSGGITVRSTDGARPTGTSTVCVWLISAS